VQDHNRALYPHAYRRGFYGAFDKKDPEEIRKSFSQGAQPDTLLNKVLKINPFEQKGQHTCLTKQI
jgi:hypothetical protein